MLHTDLYSKEAELINNSKRSLADGKCKDSITKIRLLCLSRGATGILGLARHFRVMDKDNNNVLGPDELKQGLHETGLELDDEDVQEVFNEFDENGDGAIDLTEFIVKLRPPMPQNRLSIIDRVFEKMDRNGDGYVTVDDIRRVYSVKNHPKYLSGERTEDEILTDFLNVFEQRGIVDGNVTKEEFVNYYAAISASIDNDAYFDLILRRAYNI